MKTFSPKEYRAIGLCCKRYGYRPMLCTYPMAYFQNKETGEQIKLHIGEVVAIYEQDLKENARERARQRRKAVRMRNEEYTDIA